MKRLVIAMMCLMPLVLVGCGDGDGPGQEEEAGVDGGAQASAADGATQKINWSPDVGIAMWARIGVTLAIVEELSKVFAPEEYPALADAQRTADALRVETTMENTLAVEAALNAFEEAIGPEDEERLNLAFLEVMGRMFREIEMEVMVQATERLLPELVQAFPPSQYPQIQAFQRVAESAIANWSPEAGDELEEAMAAFKGSLSEADRRRVEEIEAAEKLAGATEATEASNEMAVQMWLVDAEDRKDSMWVTPGARISKMAFNELAEGMSYSEVVAKLKREGDSLSITRETFNDVTTVTEVFQWAWENSDETHGKIEGYFMNEELRAKIYFNDIQ